MNVLTAFAGITLAGAVGFLVRSRYEKRNFVTDQYTIYSDKIKNGERNFVFLSDLHNNVFGKNNEKLIKEIDRINPDAVLIGGDMMICHEPVDISVVTQLVGELSKRYPVYYANGNHEQRMSVAKEYRTRYEAFRKALLQAGVHYLSDESILVGEDVAVTGCDLEYRYYRHRFTVPELSGRELEAHIGKPAANRYQILLLHSPLFFKGCREWGADLTLSGHFHGGTIRLPVLGGIMTPQYQFFLPWCAGRFEQDKKTMVVSRGLGTHSINIRFNNRSQLVWVTLRAEKK